MLHGKYIGPRADLKGETALLMENPDKTLLAQFDNLKLSMELTHNWVMFQRRDFELDDQRVDVFQNHDPDCNCLVCLPDPHSRFQ